MKLVFHFTFLLWTVTLIKAEWDADPRCPTGLPDTTVTVTNRGKCYQFVDREVYWPKADRYCKENGGRMLTINDPDTNDFIVSTLNALPWRNRGVWLGLHDQNGELNWEWTTENNDIGETMRFTNWGRGHPKAFLHTLRDCVRMVRGRGSWKWHEIFCSSLRWKYKFICQYDMASTTSTAQPTLAPRGDLAARVVVHKVEEGTGEQQVVEEAWPGWSVHAQDRFNHPPSTKRTTIQYNFQNDAQEHIIRPLPLKQDEIVHKKNKGPGVTVAVVACMVGVLAAVILVGIVYIKRRKSFVEHIETSVDVDYVKDVDDLDNNNDRERAENTYVINVYSNPLPVAQKLLSEIEDARPPVRIAELQDSESNMSKSRPTFDPREGAAPIVEDYQEPLSSGQRCLVMTNQDMYCIARDSNIYDEIDDDYPQESIYESMNDVRQEQV